LIATTLDDGSLNSLEKFHDFLGHAKSFAELTADIELVTYLPSHIRRRAAWKTEQLS
jgi:hypothetical protein